MQQWKRKLWAESYKPKQIAPKKRILGKIDGDNQCFLFPNLLVRETDLVKF